MSLFWLQMTRDEGSMIIQLLKSEEKYEQFLKNVSFVCHECGSFVTGTPSLIKAIDQLLDVIDSSETDSDNEDFYGALWDMKHGLLKSVMLTDEEWTRYFTRGLKEYRFAYDDQGELITDDEGHPLAYVADKVVIEFEDHCDCKKILNRLKEGD